MTATRKPTAREAWEAIDEASFQAEVERVVAMSDEEVEAELLRDGFDPRELSGTGTGSEVGETKAPQATPVPVRRLPLRTRTAPWLIAATLTLLLVGLAAATSVTLVGHGQPESPAERGAAIRKDAQTACAKAQWRTCLDRLDEADVVDPGGANDARVKTLREEAQRGGNAPR